MVAAAAGAAAAAIATTWRPVCRRPCAVTWLGRPWLHRPVTRPSLAPLPRGDDRTPKQCSAVPAAPTPPLPRKPPSRLSLDERFDLCRSVGVECIQDAELRALLASPKPELIAYDGFEPSGRMHIAQGVMKALNVNKLTRAGVTFKFWCGKGWGGELEGLGRWQGVLEGRHACSDRAPCFLPTPPAPGWQTGLPN